MLSPANRKRVQRELVQVSFDLGDVVYEADGRLRHVYFPDGAVLSFLVQLRDGGSVEAAMVGAEGMAGLAALTRTGASTMRCICQVPGEAHRLSVASLLRVMTRIPQLGTLINRYMVGLIAQLSQTAACNRHHSASQRCARWLLMTDDRLDGGHAMPFSLTQAFLANMLGVRREAVSLAAVGFQRRGMISYSRGRIAVLDRRALERAACECYVAVDARVAKGGL